MKTDVVAVIPAAGRAHNKVMVNSNLPDAMTPINGKPVIGYIIEDLFERNIYEIAIVISRLDKVTEKYIQKNYKLKTGVKIVYNDEVERGVGYSVYLGMCEFSQKKSFLICLGDTIYKGKLDLKKDFLVVSEKYEEPWKWCFVENKKNALRLIDKPQEYRGNGRVLCGIYYFKNGTSLFQSYSEIIAEKERVEMKDVIERYQPKTPFVLVPAEKWYDCGNVENYYRAKIDFLRIRNFNSLTYNDLFGYITKHSDNKKKLIYEINWYLNVPSELKIFSPRLINYTISNKQVSYSLEYYGYQTLADLFLFGSIEGKLWNIIIERLFEIIQLFKKNKSNLPYHFYKEMYYQKTIERLDILKKEAYWKEIMGYEKISINGKVYRNIGFFLPRLEEKVKQLYLKKDMGFIHGDLCLSNILFDPSNKLFKFIDPRGYFGEQSVFGDIKYDLAKLRHSFSGSYDFIVTNLFHLEKKKDVFTFEVYTEEVNKEVAKIFDKILEKNGFSLRHVRFIEALLFLSMIPLHSENRDRQTAFYLRGIQLINECV